LSIPEESELSYEIVSLSYSAFITITTKLIKIDPETIVTQHRVSDLNHIALELFQISKSFDLYPEEFNWSKIRDLEFQENAREKEMLFKNIKKYRCSNCPDFRQHVFVIYLVWNHARRKIIATTTS
jgi:antiviral helicase SKI2